MSGSRFQYQPGVAVAVVHERIAVLLDAAPGDPVVARVSDLVLAGAGVDDVLDALVTSGLKSLVDFGAFEVRPDGVRLVVRGRVRGSVGTLNGVAAERTMWHDSWQPGQDSAALAMADAAEGPTLTVGSGAVLAAMVSFADAAAPVVPPAEVAPDEVPTPAAVVEVVAAPAAPSVEPVAEPEPEAAPVVAAPVVAAPVEAAPVDEAPAAGVDFALLFGATQRPPSLPEEPEAEAEPESEPEAAAEPEPEVGGAQPRDPSATMATPLTIPPEDLPERPAPNVADAPAPSAGLITGMPWLTGAADSTPAPAPTPAPRAPTEPLAVPTPRPAAGTASPVTVEPAPVPAKPPTAPATPPEVAADRTINRASLVGRSAVVMVTAIRCAHDHFNPPYAGKCRVCGAPMPPQHPTDIPRPTLGQLRLSTGGVVPLDRPAFLGRNPQVPAGYAAEQPNLVRLPDPDKDVSGQHLEVSLDYWNVLVRDLGSTNGTEVILPGEMPVVLRANDPVIIEPGTRVVLAGTISFIFEVTA